MSVSEAFRGVVDECVELMELAPRNGFHLGPRCRVCRNNQVRKNTAQTPSYARGAPCPPPQSNPVPSHR